MQAFTLQQIFGVNAVQTINTLTISKSDLIAVGLTPTVNNSAESLLVAIILNLLSEFEGEVFDLVDYTDSKIIYSSSDDTFQSLYCFYWRKIKDNAAHVKDQIVINQYSNYAQAN